LDERRIRAGRQRGCLFGERQSIGIGRFVNLHPPDSRYIETN
jgi:hypothetical protein